MPKYISRCGQEILEIRFTTLGRRYHGICSDDKQRPKNWWERWTGTAIGWHD
jgi:hypothetical protein